MTLAEKFTILKSGYLQYISNNRSAIKYSVPKPYKIKDYMIDGVITPYHGKWRDAEVKIKYGSRA